MKPAEFITEFVLVFIITFIVCSIVTFLYSLIIHSKGIFDWGLSFTLSITFGILFPVINSREKKKSK